MPSGVLSCACPSVPPSPPDQGLSAGLPLSSAGKSLPLGWPQLSRSRAAGARATRPPTLLSEPHGTLGCVWKGCPGRLPIHEKPRWKFSTTRCRPSFLRFFIERHVANSPWRLYMENCLSNSQTLSQLNGCITKDLAEPPLRLSHFRYFQSWALTNIAYTHSWQINKKSCVCRYLHVSFKIPMC